MACEHTVRFYVLAPGDPLATEAMIEPAYAEVDEIRESGTLQEVRDRMVGSVTDQDRVEIVVRDGGAVIGYAVIAADDDLHVGRCLALQWQFVVKEHRGSVGGIFLRALLRIARSHGYRNVAYSHRVGAGVYMIRYRRV